MSALALGNELSDCEADDMARYEKPLYSKKEVNAAGKALVNGPKDADDYFNTLDIINNWRSIHGHPLNTFQTTLRNKGRRINQDVIVAQRIKRLSSIQLKLQRFPTMTLSQMQDIGGCRAILHSVDEVLSLVKSYRESEIRHKLHTYDDYIAAPKKSGYRGSI